MNPLLQCFLLLSLASSSAGNHSQQPQFHNLGFASQFDLLGYNSAPTMATLLDNSNGWHSGELAVHKLLKVPTSSRRNPTTHGFPPAYGYRVTVSPLVAVGTLDGEGRPWTTILGGERGFARPVAEGILGVQGLVDKTHDPVIQSLLGEAADGEVYQPENTKLMSALSVDLETRDRVKMAGKMVVGSVANKSDNNTVAEAQLAMHVQESLGNCPKYLNIKDIRAHVPSPQLISPSLPLPTGALALIEQADMFFISSTNGQTMDTNHRGGPAGFVRVVSNTPDSVTLVYPEYSGNRLYQTLGNLHTNPLAGIAIPDYTTSDILYLTGSTQLLVGPDAAALLPHTNLAVKITVHAARFVRDGLPIRGTPGELSPYNPPVRRLATEVPSSAAATNGATSPTATLTLTNREILTPTIARLTFLLKNQGPLPRSWHPGQHITLTFASELDQGYSHMRESDPQSLNDDYVRTFTISNPPPLPRPVSLEENDTGKSKAEDEVKVQLTVRLHGPATKLLFSQRFGAAFAPLEIGVLGFGGTEAFRIPVPASSSSAGSAEPEGAASQTKSVFVAGGIGITPLLAQAPGLLSYAATSEEDKGVEVLWTLRAEDLPLAVDSFERIDGLGGVTRVFVTGDKNKTNEDVVGRLKELGAKVEKRRLTKDDVLEARDIVKGTKYFACASPALLRSVVDWLGEEQVVFESFEY